MKKNKGKRIDSNRLNNKERRTHKNNSFSLKKFAEVIKKTINTSWIVFLVVVALFLVLVTPAVFDILNIRNAVDAATHNVSISAEEVAEARIAYSNKVQHYVECTNNMQNMNLLQKIQNSAISSVAGFNYVINKNLVITVIELYEIAVVAFPIIVFITIRLKKFIAKLNTSKKVLKKLEPTADVQLLGS